ncbi:hypothetical protein ACFL4Q_04030 [candidate division KSB1 bacterium]
MEDKATLPIWADLPVALQVRTNTGTESYSREKLRRSLLPLDLPHNTAQDVLRAIEQSLNDELRRTIHSYTIRRIAVQFLSDMVSDDAADTYSLWRKLNSGHRPLAVVLSGISGAGKSALAAACAWKIGADSVIDLDHLTGALIRNKVISLPEEIVAVLFRTENATRIESDEVDERRLIGHVEKTGHLIAKEAVSTILEAAAAGTNLVISGSLMLPWLVDLKKLSPDVIVFPVTAAYTDKSDLKRIYDRDDDRFLDTLWNLNTYFNTRSVRHKIPVIHYAGHDSSLSMLLQLCTNVLKRRLGREGVLDDSINDLRVILEELHASPSQTV